MCSCHGRERVVCNFLVSQVLFQMTAPVRSNEASYDCSFSRIHKKPVHDVRSAKSVQHSEHWKEGDVSTPVRMVRGFPALAQIVL